MEFIIFLSKLDKEILELITKAKQLFQLQRTLGKEAFQFSLMQLAQIHLKTRLLNQYNYQVLP